jgi:hypothetical protein
MNQNENEHFNYLVFVFSFVLTDPVNWYDAPSSSWLLLFMLGHELPSQRQLFRKTGIALEVG